MSNMVNSELNKVLTEFNRINDCDNIKIPRESVLNWMRNDDIEILGAIYTYCTNPKYYNNIDPNLTADDYYQFIKLYFRRCFIENPSGEWTETRYEAGWSLVNWFKTYWKDKSLPREYVSELKDWLADIYLSGDKEIRLCLSTAVLEHLFDNKSISKFFFSDWQSNPILRQAFEEAMGCAGKIKGP